MVRRLTLCLLLAVPALAVSLTPVPARATDGDSAVEGAKKAFEAGRDFARVGKVSEAAASFEKALSLVPRYPLALHELAVVLVAKGDLSGADTRLQKAVYFDPDFAAAWGNLGEVRRRRGRHAGAIEAYGHALRLDRNDADGWYGLSASLLATGEKGKGLAAIKAFLALSPSDHPHFSAAVEAGKRLSAADVRAAVPYIPAEPPAPSVAAAEAPAASSAASSPPPAAPAGPYTVHGGDDAYKAQRFVEAIQAYERSAATRSDDAVLLYKLGATYAVMGDYKSALRWWARGLVVAPEHALMRRHATLAALTVDGARTQAAPTAEPDKTAVDQAREALLAGRGADAVVVLHGAASSEAAYLRGEASLMLGGYEDARAYFKQALQAKADERGALGGLAEALVRLGETDEANTVMARWLGGDAIEPEAFMVLRARQTRGRITNGPATAEQEEEL